MALIEWNDSLSVGVASLDGQHQELVRIINDLHDAMQARKGKQVLVATLARMRVYAQTHFADEERLLKLYRYPELQDQVDRHRWFLEKVQSFEAEVASGSSAAVIEVMDFLGNWLLRHIERSDKRYSEMLREKGVV